ncbi:MAG: hypothetical protein SGARI_002853 [Bacillariaceae sp.]
MNDRDLGLCKARSLAKSSRSFFCMRRTKGRVVGGGGGWPLPREELRGEAGAIGRPCCARTTFNRFISLPVAVTGR